MLNPDVAQTEQHIQLAYDATVAITNYAQGSITAVPKVLNPPSWFGSIQKHIDSMQVTSNSWLKEICPDSREAIPFAIADFNDTFADASAKILDILAQIENQQGGIPTAEQKKTINGEIATLNNGVQVAQTTITALKNQIRNFFSLVVNSHATLSDDLNNAADKFAEGKKWIQELNACIGENYLTSQVMGPCVSIVEIDMNISIKVQESGADPTLITLVFIQAILKDQTDRQKAITDQVEEILNLWTTLDTKLDAVKKDLDNAEGKDYTDILKQIDFQVAQAQWQQVADFAKKIYG